MSKESNKKSNLGKMNQNRFFNFPERINVTTVFLIIIIYLLALTGITALAFPDYDYQAEYNYPVGTYNSEINPFVFVRGLAEEVTEQGKQTIHIKNRFIAYIKQVGESEPTNIRYAYSGLSKSGEMYYFVEDDTAALPLSHHIVSSDIYVEGGFDQYFIRLRYNVKNSNGETQTKDLELSQKVLQLNRSELKDPKFASNSNDFATVTFMIDSMTTTDYSAYIKFEFKNKENPFSVNMQSWLVSDDNSIYPFIGLYNYATPENFTQISPSKISKFLNPKYIYMKMEYITDNNAVQTMYYRVSIDDLVSAYESKNQ
jgi:hypothetical protein